MPAFCQGDFSELEEARTSRIQSKKISAHKVFLSAFLQYFVGAILSIAKLKAVFVIAICILFTNLNDPLFALEQSQRPFESRLARFFIEGVWKFFISLQLM